jgi:heme-degrading monooxygenase HmoA
VFAATPEPPYVAVIFSSRRTGLDDEGYARTAARMEALAAAQPGYLGIESARDPSSGFGITVSYWATEADARAWKQEAAHAEAQRLGASRWYERYEVRVAVVERAYGRRRDLRSAPDPGSR